MRHIYAAIPIVLLGILALSLCAPSSSADGEVVDGGLTYALTEGGGGNYAEVIEYDGSTTSVTVKATVTDGSEKTYKVRSIAQSVFKDNTVVQEITILANDSFTFNPEQFSGCTALTRVTLGEGLTEVDSSAFKNCASLEEVILPSTIVRIGDSAFQGCASLATINWPSALIAINGYAFADCTSLVNPVFGSALTSIGERAFRGCSAITSVAIPDSVKTIGTDAFRGDTQLAEVTLGNGVQSLGFSVFYGTALSELVLPASLTEVSFDYKDEARVVPDTIESISVDQANPKFMSIENMVLDKESDTILFSTARSGELIVSHNVDNNVFKGMGITELTIEEGVKSLGNYAFGRMDSLTVVSLPSTLDNVGAAAFAACPALSTINFADGTKTVGGFMACAALVNITLPASVECIGAYAFGDCSNLETINLPEGLKTIGDDAFRNCTKLTGIIIPESMTSIGARAFNAYRFESLSLGADHAVAIGADAFQVDNLTLNKISTEQAYALVSIIRGATSVTLGADFDLWEWRGDLAISKDGKILYTVKPGFEGKLTIPSSVEAIYGTGFQNLTTLTGVEYESSDSTITLDVKTNSSTYGTFYGCSNLTSVKLPRTVLLNQYTFGQCTKLTDVSFVSVVALPAYTFQGTKIKELVLNEGCTTIAANALKGITSKSLTYLSFPQSLTAVEGDLGVVLNERNTSVTPMKASPIIYNSNASNNANKLAGRVFITLVSQTTGDLYTIKEGELFIIYHAGTNTYYDITDVGKKSYGASLKATPESTLGVAGWYYDSEFTLPFDKNVAINETLHLYVKLCDKPTGTATLREYVDGFTFYEYVTKNQPHAIPDPIVPIGYTFVGWYNEKTFDTLYTGTVPNKATVNVYAKLSINQYTITFDTAGGSAIAAITQDYDSDVTAPEAPTRTGYTFAGWSAEVPAKMPVDGMTITASWTINQYTITFDTAGGSAIAAITQDYNSSVTAPSAEPSKDGYRFVKWDSEIPASMPANDVIIKAVWAIVATVNENGKSTVTLDSETSSFIPAAETKEITVEIRENTAVKVENASDLVGKTVVSKVEPVSNSTGVSGTAYEFTFTADGTQYNGKIQVTLPYTKEAGKEPVVYYWNGSESTKMNVVSSTDSSVTFETDHNSTYVVASETSPKGDGTAFLLYLGILMIAGIGVAMLVGFNFYRKKA